jgi:ribose transport system ATP-binding protein
LLTVRDVSKVFPGLRALDGVSLQVRSGEIVALLGQNGSGKSTLVKVIAGIYKADAGDVHIEKPAGVTGHGVHVIHQDLGLVEALSTVENLGLAVDAGRLRPLQHRKEIARAHELIAQFGVGFDVQCPVRSLTPAQRTIIAIARAMDGWSTPETLLVLDEPTASLHGEEVGVLFTAVRRAVERGAGVIFISHRLEEVAQLADRVVVLRDGVLVADRSAAGLTPSDVAELITGSAAVLQARSHGGSPSTSAPPALAVHGLRGRSVANLELELRPGEVVGVAGALGSGREDVCGLVFGALRRVGGTVLVDGHELRRQSPHSSLRAGMAFVPSDRRAHGAVMSLSLRENITLPELRSVTRAGFHLSDARERADASTWMRTLNIQPPTPERPLGLFSGGNQQRAVIAKWLRTKPKVLLVDEPTQGVDVGTSESIRTLLLAAAAEGMAVLVSSSDNADLVRVCSRVLIMRDGVVVRELRDAEITDHRITQECLGGLVEVG